MREYRLRYGATAEGTHMQVYGATSEGTHMQMYVMYITVVNAMLKNNETNY